MTNAVFIGGCPRSGTTLLGSILGTHSMCVATPESQFKTQVYRKFATAEGRVPDLAQARAAIEDHPRFKLWGCRIPDEAVDSYSALLQLAARSYGATSGWVDHTPDNIEHVAVLHRWFPEAKFIHVLRDPRATISSVLTLDWGPNNVRDGIDWWFRHVAFGLTAETELPEQVLRIHYEQLVEDPEKVTTEICSFLNIPYEPDMLSGRGFDVHSYTAKQHAMVGKSPMTGRINHWQKVLTEREVATIEESCVHLMTLFGYKTRLWPARPKDLADKWRMPDVVRRRLNKILKKKRTRRGIEEVQASTISRPSERGSDRPSSGT